VPGPGSYEKVDGISNRPSSIFGKERRLKNLETNNFQPGPGNYNDKVTETKKHSSTWKFGTERRDGGTQERLKVPGPGAYNSPNVMSQTGTTLKFRHNTIDKNAKLVPGPGNYETTSALRNKGGAIGKEGRFSKKSDSMYSPGPGNYEMDKSNTGSPKYAIGKGNRSDFSGAHVRFPGPGQ